MQILKKLKRIAKNDYSTVLLFDIIAKVFMAISTVLVIRILGTEEYADYTKFTSVSSVLFSIIGGGISVAYVRVAAEMVSRNKSNSKTLFNMYNLFICGLTFLMLAGIPLIKKVYGFGTLMCLLSIGNGCLLSLNKMNQSYFQSEEKYRTSGIVNNAKNIVLCLLVAVLYIVLKNATEIGVIIVTLVSNGIAFIVGYCVISSVDRRDPGVKDTLNGLSCLALMRESGWLVFYMLLVALFDQACIAIMATIASDYVIASYGVSVKYYALMLTFLNSLMTVLRVKTSDQKVVDSTDEQKYFLIRWVKKTWCPALIVTILAVTLSPCVLPILNGSGYEESVNAFQILMISAFVGYLLAPIGSIMMAANKYKMLCCLALICFGINILVCYLCIPRMGAAGAAIAVVVSNVLLNGIGAIYILCRKH